ncbi:PapD-like protein [Granulicella pectinivorans]|uniref:PapD-like protein n=2 Tax=Granulicella pectinivorans TaxID=474950 RepID=A0A1I6MKQ4_9BACT|nr:PapD-like protein [Granulicella pectinivorans]
MTTIAPPSLNIAARLLFLFFVLLAIAQAQTVTGSQSLLFAGLRGTASQGQCNAVKTDASGNLYLLLDQKDGVRILKSDPTAATVLAQALLGARGDIGLSLALDPAGNVYVAGTTTSSSLTGTPGAAFPSRIGTSTNSFVAKFDANLNPVFVTFAGTGRIAATSIAATMDAIFLTGSVFGSGLPVTPNGILQSPAYGSQQNGFVERFSSDGSTLVYATYLSGAQGDTSPAAIVADASGDAYIAGSTSASGYPTVAALVPRIQPPPAGSSPASGFLTRLTPMGDAITASTFIPGTGITSMALDTPAQNLLLTGTVALGQFPITNVQFPLVASPYQVLLRLPLNLASVLSATVVAPGTQSFVTPSQDGGAWVDGTLSTPLLPLATLSETGTAFAARVTASNTIDQTARFGGLPATDPNYASAPVLLTAVAVDASGQPIVAGAFTPSSDASLLPTERYDLPLAQPSTAVLPSAVSDVPVSTCHGSLRPGSAAYVAKLGTAAGNAALVLSTGAAPDILLRNLGSVQAENLQIVATGFSLSSTCGGALAAGAQCAIALNGGGPGSLRVQASNAPTQTATLAATSAVPTSIVFSPRELDFGIQTGSSAPISRILTVSNVGQQTQTFGSVLDLLAKTASSPFSQAATDCPATSSATIYTLNPGASCHIHFVLARNSATPDGPVQAFWTVAATGTHDVLLTGYAQSASLGLSASEIDFGTQFVSGLRTTRSLFLSNNSDTAISHTPVTLTATSPFTVIDLCPLSLLPHSVCQLQLAYHSPASASNDATTLSLDQGLTALVTGQTLPPPGATGAAVNPNLSVTPATITFATPVAVTAHSITTQSAIIANTGTSSFSLNLNLTGDFTSTSNCPAILASNTSCSVTLTFAPTAPGTRDGVLAVTAGAGTSPVYVALTGTGTSILAGNNGTLPFGATPTGEPVVQWFKVTQSFPAFSATATGAWKVVLSEDIGYGHASPASSAFLTSQTGTCFNCYLGVQFLPTATGDQTGSLTLASASASTAYVLSLTGSGLPVAGLLVTPAAQDFGTVPVHSTSPSLPFTLTNLVPSVSPVTLSSVAVTGDFAVSSDSSGGPSCTGTLGIAANCYVRVAFSPTATGTRTGTLTVQSSSGTATAHLTGYGSPDPGVSLSPNALTFENVPGRTATQQTVTITNNGSTTLSVGTVSASTSSFTATSACTALAPAANCTATVTYQPSSAPASGALSIPITATIGGAPIPSTYTVPLTGAYTSQTAGLQILPNTTDYGPALVDTIGLTRTFTLNNLTAKPVAVVLSLPRQFALTTTAPCPSLAANGSCSFSVTYLPATSGSATGTIFVQATPSDGSAPLTGIAYLQGYGTPPPNATLGITGPLSPGTGLLDFGQIVSGQQATRTITLTSISTQITVRRITSEPPFLSTNTCGKPLNPGQNCTVTLTYTANNQTSPSSTPTPPIISTGLVTIEGDALTSPATINLTASASPITVASPDNPIIISSFTASQGSLTFPPTATGNASPSQIITLTNTGTSTLRIIGLTSTSDFTAINQCDQPVTSTCTISLSFTPQLQDQASAIRNATLEIASDSGTSLEYVSLFGVSSPAQIGVIPTSLDFGSVLVGQNASMTIQVTNTGVVPVQFNGVTVSGDYSSSSNCPSPGGSLAAATSCTIQVGFSPTATGPRPGKLSLSTSASTLPLTVTLAGVGTQGQLQIAPSTLNFGPIAIGASSNLSLILKNEGTAPVTNLSLSISGDYAVTVPCSTPSLAPGQSCNLTIMFTPSATGSRPSSLIVSSSDPGSPASISLSGIGTQSGSFLLTVNGGGAASVSVHQGAPATYTLAVTPTGGFAGNVVLNCTPISLAEFASCSILPSSITLATSTAQTTALTINTLTAVQRSSLSLANARTFLCFLAPFFLVAWRRRRLLPILALLTCVILPAGCGGGPDPNLRYTQPGTYQFQATANSTSGVQISRSVTLTLVVTK